MRIEFNNNVLRGLNLPPGRKRLTATDVRVPGLQFELRQSGAFFSYRYSFSGRQRAIPIGRFGLVWVADARKRASDFARMVAMGVDPMAVKVEQRGCPTFCEFFNDRYLPFVQTNKRSWGSDLSLYRNHLHKPFGSKKMNQVGKSEIQQFLVSKVSAGSAKGTVNRMLILIRYCYNLAIEWTVSGVKDNPARGIKPLEENNKIERYLSSAESIELKAALLKSSSKHLLHIIALLLLTGARRSEALNARWEDVDPIGRVWRIPLSKSGRVRHITLSDQALVCFGQVRALNQQLLGGAADVNPYIFPNPRTFKPYRTIFVAWDTARRKAGLTNFRIHDLRHTYASTLVNNGVPLYEVQKLLGHVHIRTTERYAHLKPQRLLESASFAGLTFAHIIDE